MEGWLQMKREELKVRENVCLAVARLPRFAVASSNDSLQTLCRGCACCDPVQHPITVHKRTSHPPSQGLSRLDG